MSSVMLFGPQSQKYSLSGPLQKDCYPWSGTSGLSLGLFPTYCWCPHQVPNISKVVLSFVTEDTNSSFRVIIGSNKKLPFQGFVNDKVLYKGSSFFKKCFTLSTKNMIVTGKYRFRLLWPGKVNMHMLLMRYAKCVCGTITNNSPFLCSFLKLKEEEDLT